ncbi:hypothetical protein D3C72_2367040 [compost metagenome]
MAVDDISWLKPCLALSLLQCRGALDISLFETCARDQRPVFLMCLYQSPELGIRACGFAVRLPG